MVLSGFGVILIPDQTWRFSPTPQLTQTKIWMLLAMIAIFSAFAHVMVTITYRRLSTSVASIMTLLLIPITALISVLYFREPLTIQKIFGGILITVAGIGVSVVPGISRQQSVEDPNE